MRRAATTLRRAAPGLLLRRATPPCRHFFGWFRRRDDNPGFKVHTKMERMPQADVDFLRREILAEMRTTIEYHFKDKTRANLPADAWTHEQVQETVTRFNNVIGTLLHLYAVVGHADSLRAGPHRAGEKRDA